MNNHPNKTVIFDLGNVLLAFDFAIAAKQIARHSIRSAEDIQSLIDQSALLHQFERGEISQQQFFHEIARSCDYQADFDTFCLDFSDIFSAIDPMIQFMRSLKERHVPCVVFSNTNAMAVDWIRKTYSFFNEFDHYCLSYEHGVMKPDPEIYHQVESLTGLKGQSLFFIDDRAENIETCLRLGWTGQIHTDRKETIAKVNAWLDA